MQILADSASVKHALTWSYCKSCRYLIFQPGKTRAHTFQSQEEYQKDTIELVLDFDKQPF